MYIHQRWRHLNRGNGMRAAVKNISLSAALRPGTRKTRMVTFQRGAEKITGFLALPRAPGRHRAIIAIHEWWGLNKWVKQQAANLATNGYVVLAVDLYRGKVTANPSEARRLKRDLPEDRAIREM